jgi:hypothetical protein
LSIPEAIVELVSDLIIRPPMMRFRSPSGRVLQATILSVTKLLTIWYVATPFWAFCCRVQACVHNKLTNALVSHFARGATTTKITQLEVAPTLDTNTLLDHPTTHVSVPSCLTTAATDVLESSDSRTPTETTTGRQLEAVLPTTLHGSELGLRRTRNTVRRNQIQERTFSFP